MTQRRLHCDGASDCGAGELCCEWSAGWSTCVDATRPGACGGVELCRGDDDCVTPGAVCEQGICVRSGREVACGDQSCRGAEPICCARNGPPWSEPTFCAAEACPPHRSFELRCTAHDDCLDGQLCCASRQRSACAWFCDGGTTPVCASDADCKGVVLRGEDDVGGSEADQCRGTVLPTVSHCAPRGAFQD
ncbi:MAG: hypothetical protein KC731_29585 [Myxococcales bacterium]|nr:hypothetical protein [Myxococcales bacterium]